MANSSKGSGSFLVPLVVVATGVVVAMAATFALTGDEPPAEPTIVEGEDVRPAGAGTIPEGQADEVMEGITDQLDDVEPVAPGVDSVPPADLATPDDGTIGETDADEATAVEVTGTQPGLEDPTDAAGTVRESQAEEMRSEDSAPDEPAPAPPAPAEAADDEGTTVERTVDIEVIGAPPGRDAETELTPEPGQEVIVDPDGGGTPFIPTPSGPEGRDDETLLE
ncbi:hypothetical protein OCGS_0959 [Oceaniovalibus guishaninsula JLT2003]|uniref:Uncharacterized protein n=1 Tax=Oceaniovalibus guishaninsula JLT2003 TaxID=1231392 RepID=K2HQ13_9RHOB|nr:hypothetical protein [Oceaniovalibus guishaninsula]EKE44924.1 hypothetical protein OCGS_0959 [Oceaniovalibus guishaninsula JLT2003]